MEPWSALSSRMSSCPKANGQEAWTSADSTQSASKPKSKSRSSWRPTAQRVGARWRSTCRWRKSCTARFAAPGLNANFPLNAKAPSAGRGGDEEREVLSSVVRLARLLLSLSVGTIVLSGTLLQTIYVGRCLLLLEISWLLLGASLVWGYRIHARYITQLKRSELTIVKGPIERFSRNQVLFIAAGLILFPIFVAVNTGSGPRPAISRLELGRSAPYVAIGIDCRSGSDSGCRGEVVVRSSRTEGRRQEIGRALFANAADGPLKARVPLSPTEGRALSAGKAQRLKIEAVATGRFGNQTKATRTLQLRRPQRMAANAGRSRAANRTHRAHPSA